MHLEDARSRWIGNCPKAVKAVPLTNCGTFLKIILFPLCSLRLGALKENPQLQQTQRTGC